MDWEGPERRRRFDPDNQHRRRRSDIEDLKEKLLQTESDLRETHERLEDAEEDVRNLHMLVTGLLSAVGNIDGKMDVLTELCKGIDGKADKATSFKNAVQFAAVVIVPVLVALIGAYALLKTQAPQALPK